MSSSWQVSLCFVLPSVVAGGDGNTELFDAEIVLAPTLAHSFSGTSSHMKISRDQALADGACSTPSCTEVNVVLSP